MRVLVVGGAGYIGSHMVRCLGNAGIGVTTLDNLSSGRRTAVTHGEFVQGDLGDRALLDDLFGATRFDGVMHFAAHIEVGESVANPAKYYRNNVVNTQVLLDAMRDHGVSHFVFSSTAAIFGEPVQDKIGETYEGIVTGVTDFGLFIQHFKQVVGIIGKYDIADITLL